MFRIHPFWLTTKLWLLPIGIFWILMLALHLELGDARFETVDAAYYKELAGDFLAGRPMVLDGLLNGKGNAFSPYPPGYPVLLGFFSYLGGGLDWPVHILAHGLLLLLLALIWQKHVSLLPLGFMIFMDSPLNLAALGISEFSFLIISILVVFSLSRLELDFRSGWQFMLILCLALAILLRYAAVFFIPLLIFRWWHLKHNGMGRASRLILPFFYFLGMIALIFTLQVVDSGLPTGGDRYPNSDGFITLSNSLFRGIVDQLLFFRDYSGAAPLAVFVGLIASSGFAFVAWKNPFDIGFSAYQPDDEIHSDFVKVLSANLFTAGVFYLAFIIPLRFYYYFAEGFDTRLLGPGFCLLWLGLAVGLEEKLARQPLLIKLGYLVFAAVFFLPMKEAFGLIFGV